MITFTHPPRLRQPDGPPLEDTKVEYIPGQLLRYYLKNERLMWLRRSHTIIDPETRAPVLLAHVPADGAVFRFIAGHGPGVRA